MEDEADLVLGQDSGQVGGAGRVVEVPVTGGQAGGVRCSRWVISVEGMIAALRRVRTTEATAAQATPALFSETLQTSEATAAQWRNLS
ncbi:hypothetical protein ABZ612_34105 [Streptomyces avermitilis]|uniref:hypothetical protein n=1 Tax=Streptomyces avermitilis TaxID=33903 RepID=UPI0033E9E3A5